MIDNNQIAAARRKPRPARAPYLVVDLNACGLELALLLQRRQSLGVLHLALSSLALGLLTTTHTHTHKACDNPRA
jgi:hypothetical protein